MTDEIKNVLLIESSRLLREVLTEMLSVQPDMNVVCSPGSEDALEKAREMNPHVVLVSLDIKNTQSFSILEQIKTECPLAKVVAMGLVAEETNIVEFARAGVTGFILREATPEDFVHTIRDVAAGSTVLPLHLTNSLFTQLVAGTIANPFNGKKEPPGFDRMTTREQEIIGLISRGISNKEIASSLNIATHTVKSHVHNILEKLSLQSRLQVARYANVRQIAAQQ